MWSLTMMMHGPPVITPTNLSRKLSNKKQTRILQHHHQQMTSLANSSPHKWAVPRKLQPVPPKKNRKIIPIVLRHIRNYSRKVRPKLEGSEKRTSNSYRMEGRYNMNRFLICLHPFRKRDTWTGNWQGKLRTWKRDWRKGKVRWRSWGWNISRKSVKSSRSSQTWTSQATSSPLSTPFTPFWQNLSKKTPKIFYKSKPNSPKIHSPFMNSIIVSKTV